MYEFEGADYNDKKKADDQAVNEAQLEQLQKQLIFGRRAGKKEGSYHVEKKVELFYKTIKLQEHHFYENKDRLLELLEKENDLKYNAAILRERREIVPSSLEELPKEEDEEKERLLNTGFSDWNKNEYALFIRACEKFGRHNHEKISNVEIS